MYISNWALSNNSNDLQLLTFVTKCSILDAAGVLGLPMPKARRVEQNPQAVIFDCNIKKTKNMGYVNASVVRNKDRLDLWKCNILTFQCIMSQNGQTHFKNVAAFAARFLKHVW